MDPTCTVGEAGRKSTCEGIVFLLQPALLFPFPKAFLFVYLHKFERCWCSLPIQSYVAGRWRMHLHRDLWFMETDNFYDPSVPHPLTLSSIHRKIQEQTVGSVDLLLSSLIYFHVTFPSLPASSMASARERFLLMRNPAIFHT